jgi:hypothetical protein
MAFEPPPGSQRVTLHCRICDAQFIAESDSQGQFTGANRPMIQRVR